MSPGIYEGGFANVTGSGEDYDERFCSAKHLAELWSVEPGATVAVIPLLHNDHAE
jgi:hypothetical protein